MADEAVIFHEVFEGPIKHTPQASFHTRPHQHNMIIVLPQGSYMAGTQAP